jgi:hypothetical protein
MGKALIQYIAILVYSLALMEGTLYLLGVDPIVLLVINLLYVAYLSAHVGEAIAHEMLEYELGESFAGYDPDSDEVFTWDSVENREYQTVNSL